MIRLSGYIDPGKFRCHLSKISLILCLIASIIVASINTINRFRFERQNTTIQLMITDTDLHHLAALTGQNELTLLRELKSKVKLSTVILTETIPKGFDQKLGQQIHEIGLKLSPQFAVRETSDGTEIDKLFQVFPKQVHWGPIVFSGESVSGYPNQMQAVRDPIHRNGLSIGFREFSTQFGLRELMRSQDTPVIRLHSVKPQEAAKLGPDRLMSRYLRAVEERSIRGIILTSVSGNILQTPEWREYSHPIDYMVTLSKQLEQAGFKIQSTDIMSREPIFPIPIPASSLIIGLGIVAAMIIVLKQIWPTYNRVIEGLGWGIGVLVAVFSPQPLLALLAAIVFPALAVMTQVNRCHDVTNQEKRINPKAMMQLINMIGIALIGALLIVGLLCEKNYMLGISGFRGVKVAMIAPILILFGVYFDARIIRSKSKLMAVLTVLIIIFGIYIFRTANHFNMDIWHWEVTIREGLESAFGIRPRTKEWAIGYPLLSYVLLTWGTRYHTRWHGIFLGVGAMALVSLINSFCHIHTPMMVSLLRSGLSVLIGVIIGWIYYLAHQIIFPTRSI